MKEDGEGGGRSTRKEGKKEEVKTGEGEGSERRGGGGEASKCREEQARGMGVKGDKGYVLGMGETER